MNVLDTVRICHERDWDMLLTLDGGERGGKSSLGAEIVCIVEPKIEEDIRCGIYGSFFERYSWDWGSWHDLLKASHRRIVLREESDFLGRESMTDINRKILRILSTVGRRNNYMVLLFPDFWDLDLYARKRTRIRGYVHARNIDKLDTEGPTRGFVNWYVRVKYPFQHNGSTFWHLRAGTGRFTHFSTNSPNHAEAWARWREYEERAKEDILDSSGPDPRREIARKLKAMGWTIREIADLIGLSKSRVGEFVVAYDTTTLTDESINMDESHGATR